MKRSIEDRIDIEIEKIREDEGEPDEDLAMGPEEVYRLARDIVNEQVKQEAAKPKPKPKPKKKSPTDAEIWEFIVMVYAGNTEFDRLEAMAGDLIIKRNEAIVKGMGKRP